MTKSRYVLAGVGNRGLHLFADSIRNDFPDKCELVGLYDISQLRMEGVNQIWNTQLPTYSSYSKMLKELNPDGVIIATNDASHAEYVVQTLKAGKRAICEKPLAINAVQVRDILKADEKNSLRTNIKSLVTHNARYSSEMRQIKNMVDNGAIGKIINITFQENLDRHHGADYFRRWHRFKSNSGGLLVQKGSHHFDVINWLVGSKPRRVIARGGLRVYGKKGPFRSERCKGCSFSNQCLYYFDLDTWAGKDAESKLYSAAEVKNGYFRDGCVYDARIDIEDQMDVLYDYENGVEVSFSLNAFSSLEGARIEMEGTDGRLVFTHIYPTDWPPSDYVVPGLETFESHSLILYSFKEGRREITLDEWQEDGETDRKVMLPEIFGKSLNAPLTKWQASLEDGAYAVLVGIAANQSLENDSRPVEIRSLLED